MMRIKTTPSTAYVASALCRSVCVAAFLFAPSFALSRDQSTSIAKQDSAAETHWEEGLALANAGKLDLAEAELRKAVALKPTNAEFLRDLGTVLAMEKKFDESTSYFQRALKIEPGDLVARRYLAANLWQMHRYADAKQNLQTLLRAKPGDPQALLLFGMVSENMGDYATAVKALASVPTLVRVQPESIASLARSYYHLGDVTKARVWLMELPSHPAGESAVLLGARIADEMQDHEAAETLLISLQSKAADPPNVKYRLAVVKFHAKQFEQSQQLLQQLLDDGHKSGEIERLLASCYRAQKRDGEAIRALQYAIDLEPTNVTNYLELGNVLLADRRIVPALELAKRTVNAFPDTSGAFILKGQVELAALHFTEAIDSFTSALQFEPVSSDAMIGLARAQGGAGMNEQAKATLDRAIKKFPEKAPFELELAELLLKEAERGNKDADARAEELLKSAIARDEGLAEAHYQLGNLALRRGNPAKALVYLQSAAKLEPQSAKVHFALSRAYRRLGQDQEAARQAALYGKLKEKETPGESDLVPAPSSR